MAKRKIFDLACALLERRVRLIDLFAAHDLAVDRVAPHELQDLLSDVITFNEPRLLDKLAECGLDFSAAGDDHPIQWAIQTGCFDMVAALEKLGFACPEVEGHWVVACDEYRSWHDRC